jgi:hypothetical protein
MYDLHQAALDTFEERLRESERFHMGVGKVHETLRTLAADLDRAGIDYVVMGAMALNAHGYNRETVDVDVLVRPEGLAAFREKLVGRGYTEKFAGARKSFKNAHTGVAVEFLTTGEYPGDGKPKPVAFPDPAAVCIELHGTRFISLPKLAELKLASGMTAPHRRRDLADVQDLIRMLRLPEIFSESLDPYVRPMFLTLLAELQGGDPHSEERDSRPAT